MKMDIDQVLFEESKTQSIYPLLKAPEKFEPEEIEQAVLRNFANLALFSAVIADTALGRNFAFEEPRLNSGETCSDEDVSDWIYGLRKSFEAKMESRFVFYKDYSTSSLSEVFGRLLNSKGHGERESALKEAASWLVQQGKCLSPGLFSDLFLIDSTEEAKDIFKVVLARHLLATAQAFGSSRIKEAPVEAFYLVKWTKNVASKSGLRLEDGALAEQVALALDQAPEFYGPFSL